MRLKATPKIWENSLLICDLQSNSILKYTHSLPNYMSLEMEYKLNNSKSRYIKVYLTLILQLGGFFTWGTVVKMNVISGDLLC